MTTPTIEELEFRPKVISDSCIYFELRWPAKDRRIGVIKAAIFHGTADLGDVIIDDLQAQQAEKLALLKRAGLLRNWRKYLFLKLRGPTELRQHSIGTFLLNSTLADLRARGCRRAIGRVAEADIDEHPSLIGWYQKLGFTARERKGGYEISRQLD